MAKQTVSNPWALVDNSLVLADAHGKCVQAASNYTAVAACFMQKLLSSKLEKVKIPTIDCFLNQNPMKKENHLMLWEPEWKPNFEASDVTVPINFIRWKTMYELLLANFSSRHIKSSKALASHLAQEKPSFASLPSHVAPFVAFDVEEVGYYASALGVGERPQTQPEPEFVSTIKKSGSLFATFGMATRRLVQNEEAKRKAETILKEKAKVSVKEKLKVESLIHLIRQIEFSDEPGEPDDPAPVDSEFENYQLSGPPMFSYFAVMDGDLLRKVFNDKIETDPTEEFYPERLLVPQPLAEYVRDKLPKHFQTKAFIFIGKFRQLGPLLQPVRFVKLADIFVPMIQKSTKDMVSILCFAEIVNAQILHSLSTVVPYNSQIDNHINLIANCVTKLGSKPSGYRMYLPELLNANRLDDIYNSALRHGDDPIHGFYASLANYMKSNPSEARLRDDFNRKYLLILNVILQDPSRDQLFGMPEFLEIIEYIWNPEALKILLNSTVLFYNYCIRPFEQHYLVPSAQHRQCYTFPDSYFNVNQAEVRQLLRNSQEKIEVILRTILIQTNRFMATDPFVLRVTGDFTFVQGKYDSTLHFYANCILASFNYLSTPLICYKGAIDDLFWKKLITCLLEFKRPTEAAVTTHLINQMFEILPFIPRIIETTRDSYDALSDCFPFIGDIAVYETLSGSYCRIPLFRRLHEKLITSVMSKSFHIGGNKYLLIHEGLRRKQNWLRVLCSQIFDLIDT